MAAGRGAHVQDRPADAGRPRRRAWILALGLAALLAATAAAPAAPRTGPLDDRFAETWTTRDGLPHSTVNVIEQTRDGYLWLATWEGIARFDGEEFRVFRRGDVPGLDDDSVRALHVGPSGDLFAGSARGGVVRLHAGRWSPVAAVEGLVTDLLEEPGGRLWVATVRSGLVRVDADGRRTAITTAQGLPSDALNALARDASGRVWVGTGQGLARLDGDRAVPVPGLPRSPVLALYAPPGGGLLVGTEKGAYVLDGTRFSPLHPELATQAVIRFWRDADGTLWLGTIGAGLAHLHEGRLDWLDVDHGLPNNRVLALRRTGDGSLWVGTNGGLVRLRDAPIHTLTRANGLSDDFVRTTLLARDGRLWVGTSKGLDRIDPTTGNIETIGAGTSLATESVLALAQDANGDILVGTFHDGVLRLRDGRVAESLTLDAGLPSNEVRAILPARDGRLWIATKQGLAVRDAAGTRVYSTRDGLPGEYVQSLHEDADGTVWVGTGSGLGLIRNARARAVDLSATDAQYVYCFLDLGDPRALWMGTDRGLVRVDRANLRASRVGRAMGLPFEKVFAAVPDRQGTLWMTGNDGIARARLTDLEAVAAGRRARLDVRLFGHSDGMLTAQSNGGSTPAATLDGQGRLWVATALGVARLDPATTWQRPTPLPPIVIERFDADGRAVPIAQDVRLPAGTSRIGIEFVTPSLLDAQRVRYRYRLDGFRPEWVDFDRRHDLQFAGLAPGAYTLHLEARVPGEPSLASTGVLRFSIASRWWQRPIAWLLAGIVAGVLLGALYRARVRQLRASEQRLRTLVDQRTAALQVQTQIAERLARTDALTALANRRALDEALEHGLGEAARTGTSVCLLLVDVDRFKPINDRYSHGAGDLALRAVAEILQSQSRQHDIAARWGGDEFALLLVNCTLEAAQGVAERVRAGIEALDCEPFAPGLRLTASIGIARGTSEAELATLIERADAALYRAKHEGRNRVRADGAG